jgi:glutathione synthase
MRIAFFVNDIATENPFYGTQRLAMEAARRGHEVWYLDVDGFIYDPDEHLRAGTHRAPRGETDPERFFEQVKSEESWERIAIDELDVLMLRSDPAADFDERPWAETIGFTFGHMAAARGVVVLNDPAGLSKASNKLYFQSFPSEVRPRTKITRSPDEAKSFIEEQNGTAIVKPLTGSGGHGVFLVTPEEANVNQMLEAVLRDGYAVVQEYLEAAEEGDTRLLLVEGEPLQVDGSYAAFKRHRGEGDVRSNISVAADTPQGAEELTGPAEITKGILELAAAVGPRLRNDGMFLVGLDIAGDKLLEINVFSPGGLWSAEKHTGVDFCPAIIDAVEARAS